MVYWPRIGSQYRCLSWAAFLATEAVSSMKNVKVARPLTWERSFVSELKLRSSYRVNGTFCFNLFIVWMGGMNGHNQRCIPRRELNVYIYCANNENMTDFEKVVGSTCTSPSFSEPVSFGCLHNEPVPTRPFESPSAVWLFRYTKCLLRGWQRFIKIDNCCSCRPVAKTSEDSSSVIVFKPFLPWENNLLLPPRYIQTYWFLDL